MQQPPPAEPGMKEEQIDTPALLIDLDKCEANLDQMAAFCQKTGIKLRPHAKTHKSPVIAHWQGLRGAVGQCVQKVGEAQILAWGGVGDILVTNEIVSEVKLARLLALSNMAQITLCVDNPFAVHMIEKLAGERGKRCKLLVEINVGGERCGVQAGKPAAQLAAMIAQSKHLIFGGLQAYHGLAQHLRQGEERKQAIVDAVKKVETTKEAIRHHGLSCEIISGGGTGTFEHEAASGIYTELQAGSYLFMDAHPAPPFQQSLFVLSQVISTAQAGCIVVDCGHKGIAIDSGPPSLYGFPQATCLGVSDEHSVFSFHPHDAPFKLGEKCRLVPGHCDPTIDRHDWYVGMRGHVVDCVFPVAARGMMQ